MAIESDSLPTLALAELQRVGYTEDRSTGRAYENRYILVVVFGSTFSLVAAFLLLTQRPFIAAQPNGFLFVGAAFLCGLVMAVGAATSTGRGAAHSLRSGQPMFRFRRGDAPAGQAEIIYVDQESRTYFCRTAVEGKHAAEPATPD